MHCAENHEEYFEMVGVDLYGPDCACKQDDYNNTSEMDAAAAPW